MDWLTVAPKLISIALTLLSMYRSARDRGLGHHEAIAEALAVQAEEARRASASRAQAAENHAQKADDTAFDQDFKR